MLMIHAPLDHRLHTPLNRCVDCSGLRDPAMYNSKIGTLDPALLHLVIQDGGACHILGDDHETACIAVKTVHTTIHKWNSLSGIVRGNPISESILIMPDRRLDREIRRLVNHQEILILIHYVKLHGMRHYCDGRNLVREYGLKHVPLLQRMICEDARAVQKKSILVMTKICQEMARETAPAQKLRARRWTTRRQFIFIDSVRDCSSHPVNDPLHGKEAVIPPHG